MDLIELHRLALTVLERASTWSTLGLALALQADASPPEQRPALLGRADAALRTSLSLAPANPYVWTRLAIVRQSEGAEDVELVRYLRLSWRTGPNEERLLVPRIGLALKHWGTITELDRSRVFRDIRVAWDSRRDEILPLADTAFGANVIRAALLPDRVSLASFEAALSARHGN